MKFGGGGGARKGEGSPWISAPVETVLDQGQKQDLRKGRSRKLFTAKTWRDRFFSRPVAWLVVTMETVGQTNQPCVMTGSPPYLTIRSC